MKVVLTDTAYNDLLQIAREIRKDNPPRAASFIAELYDRCEKLGHMPRAYPLLPDREKQGIRRRSYQDYLIFYRIDAESVQVLHILHGGMDYERILFPDG
jgi:toxin ParE1/3/4